jgi:hypothetical protein
MTSTDADAGHRDSEERERERSRCRAVRKGISYFAAKSVPEFRIMKDLNQNVRRKFNNVNIFNTNVREVILNCKILIWGFCLFCYKRYIRNYFVTTFLAVTEMVNNICIRRETLDEY